MLIVDIVHCSNDDRFLWVKKQNSVICLILSQSFFPCLTLVLYGYLIIFFCYKNFTSLLAFRRSHFSYLSSSLSVLVFVSIKHLPWTFFRRAHVLRPSGWYGHQGICPNCPYQPSSTVVSF